MFLTLWEYEVKRGSEELFERQYGPDGDWVRLFRQDTRYRRTRLLRDVSAERVYVTMDWVGVAGGLAEYTEIDGRCEQLTVREKIIGGKL